MYRIKATYLPCESMEFDRDYYLDKHVALAHKQLAGRVQAKKIDVEFNVTSLFDQELVKSPCVFNLYVETSDDVAAFQTFMQSEAADVLKEDVAKYTNCEIEWTVSELVEP